jgi:hypothetical protein
MRHNYAADAHNRFAALYNNGAYTAAEAVLHEALGALPGDPILEHDMATLDEAKKPRDR